MGATEKQALASACKNLRLTGKLAVNEEVRKHTPHIRPRKRLHEARRRRKLASAVCGKCRPCELLPGQARQQQAWQLTRDQRAGPPGMQ